MRWRLVIMICTMSSTVFWAVNFLAQRDLLLRQHRGSQEQIYFGLSEMQFLNFHWWFEFWFALVISWSEDRLSNDVEKLSFFQMLWQFHFPGTIPHGTVSSSWSFWNISEYHRTFHRRKMYSRSYVDQSLELEIFFHSALLISSDGFYWLVFEVPSEAFVSF